MTRSLRFLTSESGTVSVDWLVMSATAFAVAGAVGGIVNSGVMGLASETLAQILADAVDEVGNDAANNKTNYTQGCIEPCKSNLSH